MSRSRDEVLHWFGVPDNRAAAFEPADAIFPGYLAPIIRLAADGERELVVQSWGFVLQQHGRAPKRVTNVRNDKIRTSSFWRPSFEQRRCLVPSSSCCEPKGE
jgi:putative SOS response-associated peptidase YedK